MDDLTQDAQANNSTLASATTPDPEVAKILKDLDYQFRNYLDEIEMSDVKFKVLTKFAKVNLNVPEKEPPYTLYMDSIGMIPKGDIWGIQAAYKCGKTQAACIIMAAILGDTRFGLVAAPDNKEGKVMYFDTEQAEHNTIKVGHRVRKLAGWDVSGNSPRFTAYNLREFPLEEKLPYIYGCIKRYKPVMVIVDGIADLIASINDEVQAVRCVLTLMQMASKYDCAIGSIIHLNKGAVVGKKDDEVARGHLGTALYMKVVDMFTCAKDNGIFSFTHGMSRNEENKETISWIIDDKGHLERSDKSQEVISAEVRDQKLKPWRMAFASLNTDTATFTQLTEAYRETTGLKMGAAKKHLRKAVEDGLIAHDDTIYKLI